MLPLGVPPQTIIACPLQTVLCPERAVGALAVLPFAQAGTVVLMNCR